MTRPRPSLPLVTESMQTKVLITIDTEVRTPSDRPDAFDHDVLGCSRSNSRGAYWIADELKSYGYPGVFFLDVYGSGKFRGAPYRELCDRLLACMNTHWQSKLRLSATGWHC
jgi:hypothetical protein